MLGGMKTFPTLDADMAARLRRMQQTSGQSFKAVVNEALRRGLRADIPVLPRDG